MSRLFEKALVNIINVKKDITEEQINILKKMHPEAKIVKESEPEKRIIPKWVKDARKSADEQMVCTKEEMIKTMEKREKNKDKRIIVP